MPVLTKINTNSIADDAVTGAKIPADALGATDIAANAIGTSEIATGGVLPTNIAYLGDGTGNLSGTITNQQLHFGSAFTLTDNLTVNGDVILGKVRDDGTGQSLTGDGKTLTGTGTLTMGGSLEGEPKNRTNERITTLGSVVTGTPAITDAPALIGLGTVTSGNIDAISAMVYMGKQTASSVAQLEFKHNVPVTGGTPDFSSSYSSHLFTVENYVPATDGGQMRCRYSTDLGSNYVSSGYDGFSDHGSSSYGTNLNSTDSYRMSTSVRGSDGEGWSGNCWLLGASNVKSSLFYFHGFHQTGTSAFYAIRGSYWSTQPDATAVDIDAVKFYFHSGNINTGVVHMYGLKA